MIVNTIVPLNQLIGCRILSFLDGIDATNFLEAVNDSKDFWSIAKTSDYHFIELIKQFHGHQRIILPRTLFENNMDDCQIDDEQLIVFSTRYSFVTQPSERLYVHPCFSIEGFSRLCEVYKTSLFQCYSRLLPFNTFEYDADFGLLDYESYGHTTGAQRLLNDHERSLFGINTYFTRKRDLLNMTFIHTVDEFKQNLAIRFSSATWLGAIDFTKLVIVGGCVLNALCRVPFSDTKKQDINLIYYANDTSDFENVIRTTVNLLNEMLSEDLKNQIKVENISGTVNYNVFLPCNVTLNICRAYTRNSKKPLSHILHNFDMDITQVAFTGDRIVSTFPFLQALATRSFIVYTLHAQTTNHVCTRIAKYCRRGFDLLEPIGFDGNFDFLMTQEEIPLYRVEQQRYVNEDGEIQIVTKEFRRTFPHNVDTFRIQEKFIQMVHPQLLNFS